MLIPVKKILKELEIELKSEVLKLSKKNKLKLVLFLVGDSPEQLSFVKSKQKMAKKLGVQFELVQYKTVPSFEPLLRKIKEKSLEPGVTGIAVQQPLPPQLSTESMFDFIALNKEIEGHRRKTEFYSPLALAFLTLLKFIYIHPEINKKLFLDNRRDFESIRRVIKHKQIVFITNESANGKPVTKTLSELKINFIGINPFTTNPQEYYKEADIIISSVGKKILTPELLKQGVVLFNVGVRDEKGELIGDYDEKEIDAVSSYHTGISENMEDLDILYLFKNLVDAAKMQKHK